MSRDRFEAMVAKEQLGNRFDGFFFRPEQVVKLLRREHAALVRAVTRLRWHKRSAHIDVWKTGYNQCVEDVLALLAARKGRTR